jgi:hypothetical protein
LHLRMRSRPCPQRSLACSGRRCHRLPSTLSTRCGCLAEPCRLMRTGLKVDRLIARSALQRFNRSSNGAEVQSLEQRCGDSIARATVRRFNRSSKGEEGFIRSSNGAEGFNHDRLQRALHVWSSFTSDKSCLAFDGGCWNVWLLLERSHLRDCDNTIVPSNAARKRS